MTWLHRCVVVALLTAILAGMDGAVVRASQVEDEAANCDVPEAERTLDDLEQRMVGAINAYRAELGLAPLELSPTLMQTSKWKAGALATNGPQPVRLQDHDDADRTWDQRFLDCGYPASAEFAENLGNSDGSLELMLETWKHSPPHDANLRNPTWTHIGIGRAVPIGSFAFWATAFGSEGG